MLNRCPRCAAVALALVLPALAACETERYTRPIAPSPHGAAVRANMRAHIIDPAPPAVRSLISPAHRPALAYEAYRTDTVKDPADRDTAPVTGALE